MHNWLFWGLLVDAAITILGSLLTINQIGKPRKAITPGVASIIILIQSALVVIIILAALELMHGT